LPEIREEKSAQELREQKRREAADKSNERQQRRKQRWRDMPAEGSEMTHVCFSPFLFAALGVGVILNLLLCFFAICKKNTIQAKNSILSKSQDRIKTLNKD